MNAALQTEYDSVLYPSALYPQTHPDRLATNATIFGLTSVRISRARVLELGCGDGTNLIAIAECLPHSEFLGIDLASEPIRKGNRLIEELGLNNIRLRQMDVLKTPGDIGTFDYIIAHGLYSWVPEVVREKILSLCATHLSPQGIAYISYNAYPGGHLRDLVRHMMRFHNRQFTEAKEKIKQARALVKFASQAKVKPSLWQSILAQQFDRVGRYTDSGFFHDDLGEINQPFYFYEFMEAADRHGLQYLSEADLPDMLADGFTDEAGTMLRQLENRDVVAREQYLDFLKGRAFRQTLVCRKGLEIDRDLNPDRITGLWVAGEIKLGEAPADPKSPEAQEFHGPKGAVIATNNRVVKAALKELGGAFPGRVLFPDLLMRARQGADMTDQRDESVAEDRKALAEFLSRAHAIGFVDLHSSEPAFVTRVSDRPRASRLARAQLELSDVIATRRHLTYRVEGVLARALLRCLDGTHDRAALLEKLTQVVGNQNNPLAEREAAVRDLPRQLEEQLQGLAKAGLLEA